MATHSALETFMVLPKNSKDIDRTWLVVFCIYIVIIKRDAKLLKQCSTEYIVYESLVLILTNLLYNFLLYVHVKESVSL